MAQDGRSFEEDVKRKELKERREKLERERKDVVKTVKKLLGSQNKLNVMVPKPGDRFKL